MLQLATDFQQLEFSSYAKVFRLKIDQLIEKDDKKF